MTQTKPKNVDEYIDWLSVMHDVEITDRTQAHYDSVTSKIKNDFEKSDLWLQNTQNIRKYDQEYQLETGYNLFIPLVKEPELLIKPFKSFILKTYRKNIIENSNYPNKPTEGWILPNNWYSRINDIIRTLFIVKYLDGVEFFIKRIENLSNQCGTECKYSLEAREEGYYAAHLYIRHEFEIPRVTWDTEKVDVSIEIQITTQLQEVIRKMLHKYYETKRKSLELPYVKWQWDYESDEFLANYLGHILHYIEGMIMEVREKQKEVIV